MNALDTFTIDTSSVDVPAGPVRLTGAPVALPAARKQNGYTSHPAWGMGARRFESAETTRLNQAHWRDADDVTVNTWLISQLATVRSRSTYEARQNGTILGMINTHADDIVGPDGPTLQVISDDDAYNEALEQLWQWWFAAPTPRPNFSGVSWLKLDIHSLWNSGEFLSQLITDPTAEGPVKLRIRPTHPRQLATAPEMAADPDVFMGIRFDSLGRPSQYYLHDPRPAAGTGLATSRYSTIPPDLIIHEFLVHEEDQARGIPWLNTALVPSADLRDYGDQVQDAARQMADQSALLYTNNPAAPVWDAPESTTVERRTIKMCPPGWEPFQYGSSTQPPVQYPEYVAERQRELGRPVGMPLLLVRLDATKHNYSSARLDCQNYQRAVQGIQTWLSGSPRSYGTLNRLLDELAREGRFTVPALRRRPERVQYAWTWPQRPHVDPQKEALGEGIGMKNLTITLTKALAARGETLESHIETLKRELKLIKDAGLPVPAEWISNPSSLLAMLAQESGGATVGATAE